MADGMQLSWREAPPEDFRSDVLSGLMAHRKRVASKHFYDGEGSRLFEAICELPEYYLTRTEFQLLERIAPRIAARLPPGSALVEFGSGSSTKTQLLLDAAPQLRHYIPIDISQSALFEAARDIAAKYAGLTVHPVLDDFTRKLNLPRAANDIPRVGFFPGSTIGNFTPSQAQTFLADARSTLGDEALLLVGADLAKSPDVLVPAYDDAQGVTAAFNKNLLVRFNRELGANFDLQAFSHKAVWNEVESRIEMHLVSTKTQTVQIGGVAIKFEAGETIHTENSHKFRPGAVAALAVRSGWRLEESWISKPPEFGVFLLKAA